MLGRVNRSHSTRRFCAALPCPTLLCSAPPPPHLLLTSLPFAPHCLSSQAGTIKHLLQGHYLNLHCFLDVDVRGPVYPASCLLRPLICSGVTHSAPLCCSRL